MRDFEQLFVLGLSHRTAPLSVREACYLTEERSQEWLHALFWHFPLEEGILFSTCNRTELYGVSVSKDLPSRLKDFFLVQFSLPPAAERCWTIREGEEAVRHLFRVASGLDSKIIGETEVQGQIKRALDRHRISGATGPVLTRLFEKALNAAKEVREKTGITHGKASVGAFAVEVAQKIFGETLPTKRLLMIGAGEIGKCVSRRLFSAGMRSIRVASRTYDRARDLAKNFGGEAILLEEVPRILPECDIVVSSTKCPHLLLHAETVEENLPRRKGKPVFFIDLSVPRNIDPRVAELPQSYLYHLDDLERMVASGFEVKNADLKACHEILEKKVSYFMAWFENLEEIAEKEHSLTFDALPVS